MAGLREDFWDNLLDYIQERTVIPVIGPVERGTVRHGAGGALASRTSRRGAEHRARGTVRRSGSQPDPCLRGRTRSTVTSPANGDGAWFLRSRKCRSD